MRMLILAGITQGYAPQCICLSSFRISSLTLPRKFYSCSLLISGGITPVATGCWPHRCPELTEIIENGT